MNCCDYECNQGRNCPVRQTAAKVARIGRKDYAKEPLQVSPFRVYLRHLAKWFLIVLLVMTLAPMFISIALAKAKQPPVMECGDRIQKDTAPAHIVLKCAKRS